MRIRNLNEDLYSSKKPQKKSFLTPYYKIINKSIVFITPPAV